jgi:hypothetical protein
MRRAAHASAASDALREERTLRMLEHARRASGASDADTSTGTPSTMLFEQLRMQAGNLADACAGGMEVRAHVTPGSRSVVIRGSGSGSGSGSSSSGGCSGGRRIIGGYLSAPAPAPAPAPSGYRKWGSSDGADEPAPSAFSGSRDRMSSRREEHASRAWEERRVATEKARAAKAEEVRQAKLRDFTDTEQYPTLGGGAVAAPKAKVQLNFRDMAHEAAARSTLAEAEAAAAAKRHELDLARQAYGGAGTGTIIHRHGSYDDGPVDHDFPDEEGYYSHQHGVEEDEDEAEANAHTEAELNPHLAVIRRRGDKSDW